jgi:hypothetical protein
MLAREQETLDFLRQRCVCFPPNEVEVELQCGVVHDVALGVRVCVCVCRTDSIYVDSGSERRYSHELLNQLVRLHAATPLLKGADDRTASSTGGKVCCSTTPEANQGPHVWPLGRPGVEVSSASGVLSRACDAMAAWTITAKVTIGGG